MLDQLELLVVNSIIPIARKFKETATFKDTNISDYDLARNIIARIGLRISLSNLEGFYKSKIDEIVLNSKKDVESKVR